MFNNNFKLMVIDSSGFTAMGNSDTTLLDTIRDYNRLYRKIDIPRQSDGMLGFELATQGKLTVLNQTDNEDVLRSTIYMPDELNETMQEYASVAYEFLAGYQDVTVEDNIKRSDGVYKSDTDRRTGEDARELFLEYLEKKKPKEQKGPEFTL